MFFLAAAFVANFIIQMSYMLNLQRYFPVIDPKRSCGDPKDRTNQGDPFVCVQGYQLVEYQNAGTDGQEQAHEWYHSEKQFHAATSLFWKSLLSRI